nr:MAG: hypothetical protein [uncultured archaeon]
MSEKKNSHTKLKEMINNKVEKSIEISSNITKEDLKKLNLWERKFLESIDNILDMGLMLSDKQLKKLQEIDDKLCRLEKNE